MANWQKTWGKMGPKKCTCKQTVLPKLIGILIFDTSTVHNEYFNKDDCLQSIVNQIKYFFQARLIILNWHIFDLVNKFSVQDSIF